MFFTRVLGTLGITLCVLHSVHADLLPPKSREPQFPAKSQRMLWTDTEVALARENITKYAAAGAIARNTIERADVWMAWDDVALRGIVTTADVPRAFNDATEGCPQCGMKLYEKGGTYPWIVDPKIPFKVKCPVDGSIYPSNDFAAYYASGMTDRSLLTGDYADDGRGWVSPSGEKHWFVAYANHWTWMTYIIPAAQDLARAYLLTGDGAYGRKAAVLLDRIAEVYPNMDHHPQSRYGELQAAQGGRYEGKILNHIWETGTLTSLAEAYDYVWDSITDNTVTGKTATQVRANIEANLLEEGIDAYFSGKIRGNFGMHQKALVYAGLARQFGKQDEWFDGMMNEEIGGEAGTGLNYALYNLVYRDGPPFETAPGYNFSWVANITTVAEALHRANRDVYAIPKMRRLYDGVIDVVNIGQHTPSVGDSGSVYGGFVGRDAYVYQRAWQVYQDPRFLAHLQGFNATGERGFIDFESLFEPVIPSAPPEHTDVHSRLLDGYGMAIMNNPANTISLALYYGYMGGHGHFDRLNFELYANNLVMMPDLGYPDFMNAYVPGIYTWSKNTIAHNTVTVDAKRQSTNYPGRVQRFVDEGFARALDIDAAPTYGQTQAYRRRMVMVDLDDARSYVVDSFTVQGGGEHDYSLHGPPGTFTALGGEWGEAAPGTLAGPDVPLEYIYDEPALALPGYTGSYAGYKGSGFQHLFDVQHLTGGTVAGEWSHEKDPESKIRVYRLDTPGEAILADAFISPVKYKQIIKYLIGRNKGEGISSQFVSVIEPFKGAATIQRAKSLPLSEGQGAACEITWPGPAGEAMRDVVLINAGGGILRLAGEDLHTDAGMAIVRFTQGAVTRRWFTGGTCLSIAGDNTTQTPRLEGTVIGVEPRTGRIHIAWDAPPADVTTLAGKIIHFQNDLRRTAHPILSAEPAADGIVVTVRDDLLVGRVRIGEIRPEGFTTATTLAFAPVYDGTYAADGSFGTFVPIMGVKRGVVTYTAPRTDSAPFVPGDDAWIVDVGPGDRCEISTVFDSANL